MKTHVNRVFNSGAYFLKVCCLCVSTIIGTNVYAESIYYPNFIDTIKNGNWVWSSKFAQENRALMAYASGAFDQLRLECPSHVTSSDAALAAAFFGSSWTFPLFGELTQKSTSNTQETLISLADLYATAGGYSIAGQRDVQKIIEAGGCGSSTRTFARNLVRLASGRRPEISSINGTLDEEKITPLEVRHQYDEQIDNLQYQGAMLVESDIKQFSSAGVQILECYYDKDPSDQYRELQFYWALNAISSAAVSAVPFTHMLLNQRQQKLNVAQRFPRVRHPFLAYGSPMPECPSNADESYPFRKIRVHKDRENKAFENADYPTVAPEPQQVRNREWEYNYGKVPEDYMPAIPNDYMERGTIMLKMEKGIVGNLSWIWVEPYYISLIVLNGWEEDYGGFWSPSGREMQDELLTLRGKGYYVLTCWYVNEKIGMLNFYGFWYGKNYPEGFDSHTLRSRNNKHPLLSIHSPRESCPKTREEALKIIARE